MVQVVEMGALIRAGGVKDALGKGVEVVGRGTQAEILKALLEFLLVLLLLLFPQFVMVDRELRALKLKERVETLRVQDVLVMGADQREFCEIGVTSIRSGLLLG